MTDSPETGLYGLIENKEYITTLLKELRELEIDLNDDISNFIYHITVLGNLDNHNSEAIKTRTSQINQKTQKIIILLHKAKTSRP